MQQQPSVESSQAALAMAGLNCGVKLLLAKRYHDAVATFTSLLSRLQSMKSSEECDSEDELRALDQKAAQHPWLRFLHPNQPSNLDDTHCFVFASPFIVDCSSKTTSTKAPSARTLSVMTVFNLALTYHLGAIETKPCESVFRKALAFYQAAHNLQQMFSNELGSELSTLLSLGISNNIGHIHGLVGHQAKAADCFQHLLSNIMYITDCGWTCEQVPQMDGFLHNVQNWVFEQKPAPAA